MIRRYAAMLGYIIFTCSCKTADTSELASRKSSGKTTPDYSQTKGLPLNTEYIPANEQVYFRKIANEFTAIHREQTKQMNEAKNRRGMHVKDHGCYKAEFQIQHNPAQYSKGIFATAKTYPAVVRFSNGSGVSQSDTERDLRGLALKLYDENIPPLYTYMEKGVQDFLMTNAPVHHASDIVELMGFIAASHKGGAAKAKFLATHTRMMRTLLTQTGREVDTLLNESYFSRAAFHLGKDQAMRFETTPCMKIKVDAKPSDQYLTTDLQRNLAPGKTACFDFSVRLQTDPTKEPIEDHSVEWRSPAQKVARLQVFGDKKLNREECENLRFNPWNGHVDHQPLGNFNRARLAIYNAAWKLRSGH